MPWVSGYEIDDFGALLRRSGGGCVDGDGAGGRLDMLLLWLCFEATGVVDTRRGGSSEGFCVGRGRLLLLLRRL